MDGEKWSRSGVIEEWSESLKLYIFTILTNVSFNVLDCGFEETDQDIVAVVLLLNVDCGNNQRCRRMC